MLELERPFPSSSVKFYFCKCQPRRREELGLLPPLSPHSLSFFPICFLFCLQVKIYCTSLFFYAHAPPFNLHWPPLPSSLATSWPHECTRPVALTRMLHASLPFFRSCYISIASHLLPHQISIDNTLFLLIEISRPNCIFRCVHWISIDGTLSLPVRSQDIVTYLDAVS